MAEKCACGAGRCCSQHYAVEIRWSWNGANPRHVFSFECNLYDCLNFVSHWKYLQTSQISWWCLRRLVMQIYVGGIASRGITFYTTSYNKTKNLFYPIYFKLCNSNVFFLLFILLCTVYAAETLQFPHCGTVKIKLKRRATWMWHIYEDKTSYW